MASFAKRKKITIPWVNGCWPISGTGRGEAESYHAVLIDEAQDFAPSWFQCACAALKDPDDGDLIIVGDGSQGLYRGQRDIS